MDEPRRCPVCGTELTADAPAGLCPECLLKRGLHTTNPSGTAGGKQEGGQDGGFVPPTPEELAPDFPQLSIIELVGWGGMGAVYRARQMGLDRTVALKIIRPGAPADSAFAERFAREAKALAHLNHPNIVAIYDFGLAGDRYYFIMEYVDGVTLRQMERTKRLAPREALAIVPQVCDALQYAHDEGIIHRDIKPENILLDRKGRVKIADFGLAKLLGKAPADFTLTGTGQMMGTPTYMAPEQQERPAEVDQRADIYSLGVVFYEMLTGELPLGRFPLPSQRVHVDVRLDEVVLKTLEKEPERRYQQASEVKTDVEAVSSGAAPAAAPRAAAGEVRRPLLGPAIGLIAAAAINLLALPLLMVLVVPAVVGMVYGVARAPLESSGSAMIAAALLGAGVWLAAIVVMAVGAWGMLRRRSYGLAVAGSCLAMFPCAPAFVVGLPAAIWALFVLARPEIRATFAGKQYDAKRPNQGRWKAATVVLAIVAATVFAAGLTAPLWVWVLAGHGPGGRGTDVLRATETRGGVALIGGREFPFGDPADVVFGPNGPVLADRCVRALRLEPAEAVPLNFVLRSAYHRYLAIQDEHTQKHRDPDGTLQVTISPFRDTSEAFLAQLWTELDVILNEDGRLAARRQLPLGQIFGTFGFGTGTIRVTIAETGGRFSYRTERDGVVVTDRRAVRTLPREYQRLWDKP